MKLAITGKGGAGKTTVAVFLAKYLAEQGQQVVLIDADPDANTALTLGLDPSEQPEPISELKDLIAERTGAKGTGGEFYTLNPRVDDIPDRYAVTTDGIRLLRMGRLTKGGGGCFCPENAFLKNLLAHLLFQEDQPVILDMEAGVEHLGRGTAQGVQKMLVVVEPGRRSVQTALTIRRYAADIGIHDIAVVVNKLRSKEELRAMEAQLEGLPVVAVFPFSEQIASADLEGVCPYTGSEEQKALVRELIERVTAVTG
ncbi:MAG: carbon monoxide dehydrogenase [Planctomycetes bacterium SM23_32]|nr:MAG: carbon monoxide dehydrogenase [Planctomycetes bacterium SM23_32]